MRDGGLRHIWYAVVGHDVGQIFTGSDFAVAFFSHRGSGGIGSARSGARSLDAGIGIGAVVCKYKDPVASMVPEE